jgi:hypothetical protein
MREKPPDDRNFRVIEGGKKELRQHDRQKPERTARDANIARARKLSPSLDRYLAQRPADKEERQLLLTNISRELWELPKVGGPDARNAAWPKAESKFGARPRVEGQFTWRDATEEQVGWDEQYMLEHANAIGEKLVAMEDQESKLRDLEGHLTRGAEKFYNEDTSE